MERPHREGATTIKTTRPIKKSGGALLRPSSRLRAGPTDRPGPGGRVRDLLITLVCVAFVLVCFRHDVLGLGFQLGVTVTPDRLCFLLIAGVFLVQLGRRSKTAAKLGFGEWCMLLFAGVCTLSWYFTGADVGAAKQRWLTTLFQMIFFPFTAYYVMKSTPYRQENVKRIMNCLTILGVYLGLTAVFEHYHVGRFVWPKYILDPNVGIQFGRARGPLASSIGLGPVLVVCFLAVTVRLSYSGQAMRVFLAGLALLLVVAVYFTYTRSIWLCLAIALVVVTIYNPKTRKAAIAIVAVLVVAFFSGITNKFSASGGTLFGTRSKTIEYRLVNYRVAYEVFKTSPVFGVGYGNFAGEKSLRKIQDEVTHGGGRTLDDGNHNTYLGLLAEVGLVGFLSYLGVLASMGYLCLGLLRRMGPERPMERGVIVMALSIVGIYCLVGQTGDLRYHIAIHVMAFTVFGIVASISDVTLDRSVGEGKDPPTGATEGQKDGSRIRVRRPFSSRVGFPR